MSEAKLRQNHARMEFLTQQVELLLKQFADMKTELKTIEGDIDYEKEQIHSAEELTFKVGMEQKEKFEKVEKGQEEIKNDLNTLIDHQEHHNIQKDVAFIYGFDKTITHRQQRILTFLVSNYDLKNKEFEFCNSNKIVRGIKICRDDITKLCIPLIEKGIIEFVQKGKMKLYRLNKKLPKNEIKLVEAEMEKELT